MRVRFIDLMLLLTLIHVVALKGIAHIMLILTSFIMSIEISMLLFYYVLFGIVFESCLAIKGQFMLAKNTEKKSQQKT